MRWTNRPPISNSNPIIYLIVCITIPDRIRWSTGIIRSKSNVSKALKVFQILILLSAFIVISLDWFDVDFLIIWNCFFEIKTDVEAAAELGRTLLERNRELESTVRQQQAVIDDQTQEMEVMKIKHM